MLQSIMTSSTRYCFIVLSGRFGDQGQRSITSSMQHGFYFSVYLEIGWFAHRDRLIPESIVQLIRVRLRVELTFASAEVNVNATTLQNS